MKINTNDDNEELTKSEIEMIDWMVKMVNEGKITMPEILKIIKDEKERNSK